VPSRPANDRHVLTGEQWPVAVSAVRYAAILESVLARRAQAPMGGTGCDNNAATTLWARCPPSSVATTKPPSSCSMLVTPDMTISAPGSVALPHARSKRQGFFMYPAGENDGGPSDS
jgi:hypothetical protein